MSHRPSNESGTVVILLVLALGFILMGLAALVVDVGGLTGAVSSKHGEAKAAALAGLSEFFKHETDNLTRWTKAVEQVNFRLQQAGLHTAEPFGDPSEELAVTPGRIIRENNSENFIAYTSTSDLAQTPNAIRIAGPAGSYNHSVFGRMIGAASTSIPVHAVSTLIPRLVIFLIDVSGSTVAFTHPRWRRLNNTPPYQPECGMGHAYAYHHKNGIVQNLNYASYPESWNWLVNYFPDSGSSNTPPPQCPEQPSSYANYASDYTSITVYGSDRRASIPDYDLHPEPAPDEPREDSTWFVDTDSSPEPLGSILNAVNATMDVFEDLAVPGDGVGLVAFDSQTGWNRTIVVNNRWDDLKALTNFADNNLPGAAPWPANHLPPAASTGRLGAVMRGWFPGLRPFTDIFRGLNLSSSLFHSAAATLGDIPFRPQIILLTDGKQSCKREPPSNIQICERDHATYLEGIDQVLDLAATQFAPASIPVNVILFGEDAKKVRLSSGYPDDPLSNQDQPCMSDSEFRTKFPLLGDASGFSANEVVENMHYLAMLTKGMFFLVRPPEPGCTATSDRTPPNCTNPCPNPPNCAGFTDDFDPFCRDATTQISEYFKTILGFHPYRIAIAK